MPILIVGGDLDSLTPLLDAPVFGPELGENVDDRHAAQHRPRDLQGDDFLVEGMRCARTVIRSFLRGALDRACAAAIPALHTPAYRYVPRRAGDARLRSRPGRGRAARRAIGVQAFADAVFRRYYSGVDRGPGLRGGTFTAKGDDVHAARHPLHADAPSAAPAAGTPRPAARGCDLTVGGVTVTPSGTRRTPQATAGSATPCSRLRPVTSGMDAFLAIVSRREVRAYDGRAAAGGRRPPHPRGRPPRRQLAEPPAAPLRRAARPRGGRRRRSANPDNVRGAALVVAIVVSGKGPLALDAGRAAQNMMLAAHNEGIGSCPNGLADAEAMAAGSARSRASRSRRSSPSATRRGRATRSAARAEEWIERADRKPFDDVVSER